MNMETERRKTPWRHVDDELPKDGQIVVTCSLMSLQASAEYPGGVEPVSAFGVAVFRKEVEYGEEYEPEYQETRENVFCTEMWDCPEGEVEWWMPMPTLPEQGLEAYMKAIKARAGIKDYTETDNKQHI